MNPGVVIATAQRVLRQLRHDVRTLALIVVVPCALVVLFKYVLEGVPGHSSASGCRSSGSSP